MTDYPNWFKVTAEQNFEECVPKDKPIKALQIGAFTGDASKWLLDNCDVELLVDVDTWGGSDESAHAEFDWNDVKETYYNKVNPDGSAPVISHVMTSDTYFAYASEYGEHKFDFIYIDGDHTALQVALDGLNAFRLLKSGGIMAFDDLTWRSGKGEFYDPMSGIEAVWNVVSSKAEIIAQNSQLWIRKK